MRLRMRQARAGSGLDERDGAFVAPPSHRDCAIIDANRSAADAPPYVRPAWIELAAEDHKPPIWVRLLVMVGVSLALWGLIGWAAATVWSLLHAT